MPETDPVDELRALHRAIDDAVKPLEEFHAARLECRRGCSACCLDGLSVFEVEAENIRRHASELLAGEQPAPEGACAFLDEQGACRIYEHRPYVCRTQGLPLRWLEERDGQVVELRDICELNEEGEPIENLEPERCWPIGPVETRLQQVQERFGKSGAERVSLRSLFG